MQSNNLVTAIKTVKKRIQDAQEQGLHSLANNLTTKLYILENRPDHNASVIREVINS